MYIVKKIIIIIVVVVVVVIATFHYSAIMQCSGKLVKRFYYCNEI